ncbi:hypothetical protein OQA88_8624 [Cercophora sp. LCS_1]
MFSPTFGNPNATRRMINDFPQIPPELMKMADDIIKLLHKRNKTDDIFDHFSNKREEFWSRVFDDWDTQTAVRKPDRDAPTTDKPPGMACGVINRDLPDFSGSDGPSPPERKAGSRAFILVRKFRNFGLEFWWTDQRGNPVSDYCVSLVGDISIARARALAVQTFDTWHVDKIQTDNWDTAIYWARNRLVWKLDFGELEKTDKEQAESRGRAWVMHNGIDTPFKEPFDHLLEIRTCEDILKEMADVYKVLTR